MPASLRKTTACVVVAHQFAASRFEQSYLREIYDLLLQVGRSDPAAAAHGAAELVHSSQELMPAEETPHAQTHLRQCGSPSS